MRRKDCGQSIHLWIGRSLAIMCLLLGATVVRADAPQTVRLWSSAVVIGDHVLIGDLCELTGFEASAHERLRNLVVVEAPPTAGSKVITLKRLREVVTGAGINMAETIVNGAAECGVSRPRAFSAKSESKPAVQALTDEPSTPAPVTMRNAIESYFERDLAEYGGRLDIDFGHRRESELALSGPEFEFSVRRRRGQPLGLIELEVDVFREGRLTQTVSLQPIVRLVRRVVIARRAINQKAPVRSEDVQFTEMTFDRLDRVGVASVARVINQRAKNFIPQGTLIQPGDLETVPLVKRGQLVDVISRAGGITVVTVAKAMESGSLGDAVEVREGGGRRGTILMTVITGPGHVEVMGDVVADAGVPSERWALSGGRP